MLRRKATRAIVLDGDQILLLYTKRYDDYTLPGGGLEDGEDFQEGLIRELKEETGAKAIRNIRPIGVYEEYRPWYRDNFDTLQMESFCYQCDIDPELGPTQFEPHELQNGMTPIWISIDEALTHNRRTFEHSEKKGLSLEREIFLLQLIKEELMVIKEEAS